MENNVADCTSVQSDNRNDSSNSIISNLGSLVEQVRANMKLIESGSPVKRRSAIRKRLPTSLCSTMSRREL
jgi:hypothetical protein